MTHLPTGGAGRNDRLASVAGVLRKQGHDYDEILGALLAHPERRGLGEAEVRGIAKSAMNWPAGERREAMAARSFRNAVEELAFRRGWRESALLAMGAVVEKGVVKFPMRDSSGAVVGHRLRRGDNGLFKNGAKALSKKGEPLGLLGAWPLPEGVVLIVEGETDGAAALSAVPGLAVVAKPGARPGTRCVEWLQRLLAGRDVVLAPDGDAAGLRGGEETARALVAAGCTVRVIPPLDGLDLDKRLARVAESERGAKLRELLDNAVDWRPGMWAASASGAAAVESKDCMQSVATVTKSKLSVDSGEAVEVEAEVLGDGEAGDDGRPEVRLGPDEKRVADEVLAHLAARDSGLFVHRGQLATILDGDEIDAARLVGLSDAGLRERIAGLVRVVGSRGDANVPKWLPLALLARGAWAGVRVCRGVVESPFMRADGSICQAAGWDAASGFFLAMRETFPRVPDVPTMSDAHDALARLRAVACDFPFRDECHRSVWLFALLGMACRGGFEGPMPGVVISGNNRGTGKSKLARLASLIATGRAVRPMTLPANNAEAEKVLLAQVEAGRRAILIDNLGEGRALGFDVLDAALGSGEIEGRRLGTNELISRAFDVQVFGTGNNATIRGDMARRCLWIELLCDDAAPWERAPDSFAHADLDGFVRANRARLLVDALTVARAFVAAGRPKTAARSLGGFEGAMALCGGALVWAGMDDPVRSRDDRGEDADPEAVFHEAALDAVARLGDAGERGVTSGELLADEGEEWRAALVEAFGIMPTPGKLGTKLGHLRGRVARSGRRLAKRKVGVWRWFVERVGPAKATTQARERLRGGDAAGKVGGDA